MEGFIKLSRKTFNHPLWKEAREYSRFEAWLDLIQSAKIEDGGAMYNGNLIDIRRGEVFISLRYLAERWKWSKNTVDRYLKVLEDNSMLKVRRDRGATVVTLTNFELYNGRGTSTGNGRDRDGTETGQSIRIKEYKNEIIQYKKINKKSPPLDFFDEKINLCNSDDNEIIDFLIKEKEKSCAKKEKPPPEIPTMQAFAAFGKSKAPYVSQQALELKYIAWYENGWKTGKGAQIINWKTTLLHTIPFLPKQNLQNGSTENKSGANDTISGIKVAPLAKFLGCSPDELSRFTANGGE